MVKVRATSNFEYLGAKYTQNQLLEVSEEQATFLVKCEAVVVVGTEAPVEETLLSTDDVLPVEDAEPVTEEVVIVPSTPLEVSEPDVQELQSAFEATGSAPITESVTETAPVTEPAPVSVILQ